MLKSPTILKNKTFDEFQSKMENLKNMRPTQDVKDSGEVLSEIESILLNNEFRSDLKCLNSKDYVKLWH